MIQNKIFRNFAKLLLILLIVAFIFWGFGDAFRTKHSNYAIKVDDVEYSYHHWNEIINNNIKERKVKYGKDLSFEEINDLKQHLAKQIIDSTLLYVEAKNLGIVASDNMVKKEILKIPIFFKDGKFNKDLFDQTIKEHGLSEEAFIKEIKEQLIRNIFVDSLLGNKLTIPELINIILQNILETREVELIKIPFKAFKATAILPKREDLTAIYEQNKNSFKIPEKRHISYITISSDNNTGQDEEVDDKKLYDIYKEKSFLFTESEKRVIKQIQFHSLDIAKKARSELEKGADFEMIAKKYSPHFKKINLGTKTNKDFEEKISEQLFKLKKGEISTIIETSSGIYLFQIVDIIPAKIKKYNEVKGQIRNEYLKGVQFEKFLTLVKEIETQLKDGKDIISIAKSHNLKIKQAEISKESNNKQLVENAFKIALNTQSPLFSISANEFLVLKVNKIIDEKVKDFTEVKDSIYDIWYNQAISNSANKLLFATNQGYNSKSNAAVINFKDVKITNIMVTRENIKQDMPFVFLQQLFNLDRDKFTKPYIDYLNKEVLFARLSKIHLPSIDKIKQYSKLYESQIQQIEQEAILTEVLHHLRKKYEVKIGQQVVSSSNLEE